MIVTSFIIMLINILSVVMTLTSKTISKDHFKIGLAYLFADLVVLFTLVKGF
jgi:hypothetical protein